MRWARRMSIAARQARRGGGVSDLELELMRLEVGLSISRFCVVAGIHRATWHRRGARARERRESRWPAPERDRIEQPVARLALEWPAWGHRKIWALLRADGLRLGSQATVLRALRRRGLIQPPGALRERRELPVSAARHSSRPSCAATASGSSTSRSSRPPAAAPGTSAAWSTITASSP